MKTTPFGPLPDEPAQNFERVPPHLRRNGGADDDASLPGLWSAACGLFEGLIGLFGGAADLADTWWLEPAPRRMLPRWLCSLELLVRRLILAAALMMKVDIGLPCFARRAFQKARAPLPELDAARPEDWRLGFGVWRVAAGAGENISRPEPVGLPRPPAPGWPHPQWLLARRVEGLRRALDNPDRLVLRLARRIARAEEQTHAPIAFDAREPRWLDPDRHPYPAGWENACVHEHILAAMRKRKPEG